MKILFLAILICSSFLFPSSSFASHVELKPCVEIAHCVREEWEVNNIEKPFEEIKILICNDVSNYFGRKHKCFYIQDLICISNNPQKKRSLRERSF